jgi:hypothetical protein
VKKTFFVAPIILIIFTLSLFAKKIEKNHKNCDHHFKCLENLEVDIDDDILILTCQSDDDLWIEISAGGSLYISDHRVYLDRYQQKLVAEYYDQFMDIIDQAKLIGKEGAKIGVKGAKIGILAAGAIIKMFVTDYDSDDLEEKMEEEAEELEDRAEDLEEMVEELEEQAEDFEELHYTMKSEINELNELDWF